MMRPPSRTSLPASVLVVVSLLAATLLAVTGSSRAAQSLVLTDAPSTPILDNFNRADENPLSQGGNWSSAGVDGGAALILSNSQVSGNGRSSHRVAQTSEPMEAYATISAGPATLQALTVFIALNDVGTSAWDGYGLRVINVFSTDEQYRIRKIVDGVETNIPGGGWDEPFSGAGERLLLRKEGDMLEAWKSNAGSGTWTLKASVTDSSYSSGRIGLRVTAQSGGGAAWDDFGGGGIVTGGGPPPPAQSNGTSCGRGSIALTASCTLSDPVNTLTGSFVHQEQDLSLPGTGVTFDWTRTYTSGDATAGSLGPGWTHSYAAKLLIEGDGDVTARGEEGQELFFSKQGDGSYVGAAGALASLSLNGGVYTLMRSDQVAYTFDAQGVLTSIKDRNNQGLTFGYTSGRLVTVTDAAGRQATVSYNASNLVSQVSLQDGRSVGYGYTSGRLTSVTDVRGNYTCDAAGRLLTTTDPLGNVTTNHARPRRKPAYRDHHRRRAGDEDLRLRPDGPPDLGLLPGRVVPRGLRPLHPLEL